MHSRLVVIASQNPVKVQAALNGFRRMFPQFTFAAEAIQVPSGVADQPMTDEETRQGARNRVVNARLARPAADFWIGIEGGVERLGTELSALAWVVVQSASGEGKARSGTFFLPPRIQALVEQGMELGAADDLVFGHTNSKQQGGAIGLLTGQVVDRMGLYEQAVILALVPFINEALYVNAPAASAPAGHNR